jgi:hypothetical protein
MVDEGVPEMVNLPASSPKSPTEFVFGEEHG